MTPVGHPKLGAQVTVHFTAEEVGLLREQASGRRIGYSELIREILQDHRPLKSLRTGWHYTQGGAAGYL